MLVFADPRFSNWSRPLLRLPGFRQGHFVTHRFTNQELQIKLKTNAYKKPCLIIGTVAPPDEELTHILQLSHTLHQEGAQSITTFFPYLAYARQDKRESGKSRGFLWLGELLASAGVNKIITVDLHGIHRQFPLPLISLSPDQAFLRLLQRFDPEKITLVAPDEGILARCRSLRRQLKLARPVAYFQKTRTTRGIAHSKLLGKVSQQVVVIDDILDTGGTLVSCCQKLTHQGIHDITIIVTHGLFTGTAWQKLWSLGVKRLYCSDTIPNATQHSKRIRLIPLPSTLKSELISSLRP
jgi:ribose-phosphate pyrophosphokinase